MRRRAKRSPTALARIDLDELAADARLSLQNRYGDQAWADALPATCPYDLGQTLDPSFFPVNRHGLGE